MSAKNDGDTGGAAPPAASMAARSLGYHLRQVSESWSGALKSRLDALGVTEGQWRYLRELWGSEGLTQRELSERTGRQGPTTVAALRLLVRSGFATIEAADHDRRKTIVRLTRKGRELRGRMAAIVAEVEAIGLAGLSPGEVVAFKRLIVRTQRNLDARGSGRNQWARMRTDDLAREIGL